MSKEMNEKMEEELTFVTDSRRICSRVLLAHIILKRGEKMVGCGDISDQV
jgi:hypothetical protein